MRRKAWNDADRQMFADGLRTRASTHADKRKRASKRACRSWKRNTSDDK